MSPIRRIRAFLLPLPLVAFAHLAHAQTRWDDYPPLPGKFQPPSYDVPPSLPPAPGASVPLPPAAPPLPEPPSAPFGARGQYVLDGSTNIGFSSTKYDSSSASQLSASFSPSLSYFVFKNVSFGLVLGVGYSDDVGYTAAGTLVETKSTSFSAGARVGLNVPFNRTVSWWLTGTVGVESNSSSEGLAGQGAATSTSQNGPWFSLYLPLLVHPAPHFFLGAGPSLYHEVGAIEGSGGPGDQRTVIGAGFLIGGEWGGATRAPAIPAAGASTSPTAPPATRVPRFGEQGEVVLSDELVASVASTAYAGSTSSALSGSLAVGADIFFLDHVSVGLAFNAGWSNTAVQDASANPVTSSDNQYGVAVRMGVEIPLASALSLYPRVSLGVEQGSASEQSTAGTESYTYQEVWAGAFVPIIFRVAPHFFTGVGPSISRDVSNTFTFPDGQQASTPGTTLGAGVTVGGWL